MNFVLLSDRLYNFCAILSSSNLKIHFCPKNGELGFLVNQNFNSVLIYFFIELFFFLKFNKHTLFTNWCKKIRCKYDQHMYILQLSLSYLISKTSNLRSIPVYSWIFMTSPLFLLQLISFLPHQIISTCIKCILFDEIYLRLQITDNLVIVDKRYPSLPHPTPQTIPLRNGLPTLYALFNANDFFLRTVKETFDRRFDHTSA